LQIFSQKIAILVEFTLAKKKIPNFGNFHHKRNYKFNNFCLIGSKIAQQQTCTCFRDFQLGYQKWRWGLIVWKGYNEGLGALVWGYFMDNSINYVRNILGDNNSLMLIVVISA
jgi:hypothetical protein